MENMSQRFPCLQCNRTYSRKHDMERHVDICHTATTDKPFRCEQCNFVFSTEEKLRTHEKDHSQEVKFHCEICERAFKNSMTWKRHMKAHLDPKSFVCGVCQRKFGREHDMHRHTVRMHTGERKFQCDLCPSKFAWFSDLTIHKRRHNVMRKFKKAVKFETHGDVPKKVKKKMPLKRKTEKNRHANPLMCRMCSQSFTSFSSLQLHICDLDSSAEEDKKLKDNSVESENGRTCFQDEDDFESCSALQNHTSDNKSFSESGENENEESNIAGDSGDLDNTSNQGHSEDITVKDSMGNFNFEEDFFEESNTVSSVTNSKRPYSPESNAVQTEEADSVKAKRLKATRDENLQSTTSQKAFMTPHTLHTCLNENAVSYAHNDDSSIKDQAMYGVVPSADIFEILDSKHPGKESRQLTDIDDADTHPKSVTDNSSKSEEDLNLKSHGDENVESDVDKKIKSTVCVISVPQVDTNHESDVPTNGKTDVVANPNTLVITNSKSAQDTIVEFNNECLKCKVCQKVFSKFSALQLHLCEEPNNQDQSLKVPEPLTHSKDVMKKEKPFQNSSQIKRMVTRSKSINTKTSQNSNNLKTTMVTRSKGSAKEQKERPVRNIISTQASPAVQNPTDQGTFWCVECPETFLKLQQLKKHFLMKHKKTLSFTCSICKRVFGTKSKLETHLYSHKHVQPHQCEVCGHKFKHKRDLLRHQLKHNIKEPLNCKFCQKEFSRNYDLERHIEGVHPAKAPYRCEICHGAFTSLQELNKHLTYHEKTHPYTCSVCKRGLSSIQILKRHMKMHSNEKPYSCPECKRGFNRRHDMYQHSKIHGTERLTCDLCSRKFVTVGNLRKHFKKKHSLSSNSVS